MADPISIELPDRLVGPRVVVRPYRPEDAAPLFEAIEESRAHLQPWIPWANEYHAVDEARAFVARAQARWLLREELVAGIFDGATGRFLGGSGLHRIDWTLRVFEIGYWIRVSEQRRGYVRETVQILTRLAFDHLDAVRVEIRVDPRNERSLRIPEPLGFMREGTLRRCAPPAADEPASDRVIFAMIRDDYERAPWAARPGTG